MENKLYPFPHYDSFNNQGRTRSETTKLNQAVSNPPNTLNANVENVPTELETINLPEIPHRTEDFFKYDYHELLDSEKLPRYYATKSILKAVNWEEKIIQLPNICISDYDFDRFKFENQFIKMVNRSQVVDDYLKQLDKAKGKSYFNLYLYSCSGTGKSYIMYQLACKLLQEKSPYRVVYINKSPIGGALVTTVLKHLSIVSDGDQFIDKNTLNDCIASSLIMSKTGTSMEQQFNILDNVVIHLHEMKRLYKSNNLYLIFIMDQTNIILSDRNPASISFQFIYKLLRGALVIISGSANNETESFKNLNEQTPSIRFDVDQFNAMRHIYQSGFQIETVEVAEQVLDITGGIPFELDRFMKIETDDLNDRFIKYKNDFLNRFDKAVLFEWYRVQPSSYHDDIIINMRNIFLGLNIPPSSLFDKRIIVKVKKDNLEYLKPISNLAYSALYKCYASLIDVSVKDEFNSILTRDIPNSAKGTIIEKHLIDIIRLNERTEFTIIGKSQLKYNLIIEDFSAVYFDGSYSPGYRESLEKNLLFVPRSTNYPGYDFIYFKGARSPKYAFFFQVSIEKGVYNHFDKNCVNLLEPGNRLRKLMFSWLSFFPEGTEIYDVYIIPKKYYTEERKDMNLVYFADLEDFKAVEDNI